MVDKVELIYPPKLISPKGLIGAEEEPMPLNDDGTRDESIAIKFKIGAYSYTLNFSATRNYANAGKKKDLHENVDASLLVKKDSKQVAKLQCVNDTISGVRKSFLRNFDLLE